MAEYFGNLGDVLADFSARVVIGSLAIALGLAMIGSTCYAWLRGKGGRDPLAPLCGLMFAVSVASMVIAVGYVRSTSDRPTGDGRPIETPLSGHALLEAADADRDGHLSPREGAGLVLRADSGRKGYADRFDLDHVRKLDPAPLLIAATKPGEPPIEDAKPCHSESCGPMSMPACFPPIGGLTGHDTWPLIGRHSGPDRSSGL